MYNIQTKYCTNMQIFNVQLYSFINKEQICKCTNVLTKKKIYKYTNIKIYKYTNIQIYKYTNVQRYESITVT